MACATKAFLHLFFLLFPLYFSASLNTFNIHTLVLNQTQYSPLQRSCFIYPSSHITMKKNYITDSSKPDRKTVEKNRRIHMNGLCFKLASLIPNPNKGTSSQQDRLDHAAFYIKELQDRVEELKRKKQSLEGTNIDNNRSSNNSVPVGVKLPVLEVTDMDSKLEVVLISSLNKKFMFYQVISILKEEGADVVNATFSRVGDRIFHTIHSQVTNSRVGIETSRIFMRLKELVS